MRATRRFAVGLLVLGVWLAAASAAAAAPGPAWQLNLEALPTHLRPGTTGTISSAPIYVLVATNVGAGDATGPVTLSVTLPSGVKPIFDATAPAGVASDVSVPNPTCSKAPGQTVTCTAVGPVHPSRNLTVRIPVEVPSALASGTVLPDATASVESPAATRVAASAATTIDAEPAPFGFLPGPSGLSMLLTQEDGSPSLGAGLHPDQLTLSLGFPVDQPHGEGLTTGAGHPRDIVADLPPGLVIDPQATSVRCTEVEFISGAGTNPGCPAQSQIGVVAVLTEAIGPKPLVAALYNMVPPPGAAASVAFTLPGGVFVHVLGGVRSDSDYGIYAESRDTLARSEQPVEQVQAQIWGEPTSSSHDQTRDECLKEETTRFCTVDRHDAPTITMPSACSDNLTVAAEARSWEESEEGVEGPPNPLPHRRSAEATSVSGIPTGVSECSLVKFEPALTFRPDTQSAESPTGAAVDLHVPQSVDLERATSNLRDATVTLPQGLAVNPASAGGLEGCSETQIGYLAEGSEPGVHFTNAPDNCPDGAKIGSLEVITPLLDHPILGSVYVASPHENPFGTLLAIYISINDPADGVFAKLAGKVKADPVTGQLTTTFTENPELPVEDFRLEFFGGPRAALRTPSDCGSYATTSALGPWSGTPPVHTSDSFAVSRGANGGACTSDEGQRPNSPGFEAGTLTPIAASYSPFVMNLKREDGQQLIKGLDLALPPGLTGKLAGITTCSDAQIAQARSREHEGGGREELTSPSCPSDSQVGEVSVGAGAGSQPYYTKGKIYLAGPYEGAPLSFAIITPAVAGPYDLGNVVVRAAAHVDPITAAISVHSDALPTILDGIPLQVRDIRVSMNRPAFILNPSSCEKFSVTGAETSALGATAGLVSPFKVGGCKGLDFKPKLSPRLKGETKRSGDPALTAVLTQPFGQANIARAVVALPHSEFLDQAHIRTVCTRVQFAVNQCPRGSVYGEAEATTPLLEEKLSGPVYLRSSDNPLPDLVAVLRGPASRPLEIVLDGRVDSIHGGIRNSFDYVPDQPVSRFVLRMQGGKKGLLENSRNICKTKNRASAKFTGQNGKTSRSTPVLKAQCPKAHKRKGHKKHKG
jgi:hypothetical protein